MTIEEYMKEHKLNLKELASILEMAPSAVRKHKDGITKEVRYKTLKKFEALGIDLHQGLKVTGVPTGAEMPKEVVIEVCPIKRTINTIKKERNGRLILQTKKEVMAIREFCKKNWYDIKINDLKRGYEVRFKYKGDYA